MGVYLGEQDFENNPDNHHSIITTTHRSIYL